MFSVHYNELYRKWLRMIQELVLWWLPSQMITGSVLGLFTQMYVPCESVK